jgi:predicted DCC family thiol-disulfide oxidoreductase YuxK
METRNIIFFDGVCNFCNFWVRFILKRDRKKYFLFAPLQGKTATEVLHGFDPANMSLNSVILMEGSRLYTKSSASLRIARKLSGAWKLFYLFIVVPKPIRDWVYDIIARNRYKWFGKRGECVAGGGQQFLE